MHPGCSPGEPAEGAHLVTVNSEEARQRIITAAAAGTTTEWLLALPAPLAVTMSGIIWDLAAIVRSAAGARALSARVLYLGGIAIGGNGRAAARQVAPPGARIRYAPAPPEPVIIGMPSIAVLLPPPGSGAAEPVWASGEPRLVRKLAAMFDLSWRAAAPLAPEPAPRAMGPSAGDVNQQRHVIVLLESGLTYKAAARRLQVSERTVRRRFAQIVHELEAGNRAQAFAAAARQGWLD